MLRAHRFAWLACALVAPARASAAEENAHAAGVDAGAALSAVRDDLLVPLAFSGGGFSLRGSYAGWWGPALVEGELVAGASILSTRHWQPGTALDGRIGARVLFPIATPAEDAWGLAVGPAVAASNDVFYLFSWDYSHAYWIGARWLGAAVQATGSVLPEVRADLLLELGVAGWIARPPPYRYNKEDPLRDPLFYLQEPGRDLELATIADFQALRVLLSFALTEDLRAPPSGWIAGLEARVLRAGEAEGAFAIEVGARAGWRWGW